MWQYHIGGSGEGLQLTKRKNWQQDAGEPSVSPDGRYLYYSEDVTPGGMFQYNKDPYGVIYAIQRLDLQTGKTEQYINGAGGSIRPQISPDGKWLAFIRRVRLKSVLYISEIETGREIVLNENMSHDQQEAWCLFGVYPGFSWMPDGKEIIVWAKGKIRRINVAKKNVVQIPFQAHVKQTIAEALRFHQEVSPEKFDVKALRWIIVSPDEKTVVYQALGKLWKKDLPDGTPVRITNDETRFELFPSVSSDGKWLTYVSWNDEEKSIIWKVQLNGKNQTKLTTKKGTYLDPHFSSDGKKIVFRRDGGDDLRGSDYSKEQGIYYIQSDGNGEMKMICEEGNYPLFNKNADRVFLQSNEEGKTALISIGLNGEQRRVHFISDNADIILPSHDEQWVALIERFNIHIATFPKTGKAIDISPGTSDFPMKKVTRDAGTYVQWNSNDTKLFWSLGPELFSRELTNTFTFVAGAKDSVQEKPDTAGVYIGFKSKTDVPTGSLALVGATVITMNGDEVLENATILIEQNRITQIGKNISVPSDVKTVDVKGKYIMPGMIDVHAHQGFDSYFTPQSHWRWYANLAFGVTTMHDPSSNTESVFPNSEMLKAGIAVGPRLYSTGAILYGAEASVKAIVNTYDDALSHLRRLKAVGAFSVKSYNQPRREQRQMFIEAARNLQMMVVPEGGSTFFWNMSMILDGHTGVEHNFPIAPLYKDALTLFSKSNTGNTPTLVVAYGGLSGEYYWYQHSNVWENERLLQFTPREIIDARSRRRMMAEEGDYNHIEVSKSLKTAMDMGAHVQLGAHGQLQGLGAHWELWMLAQGGMSPLEAIRCATINGAWYLGLDKDLGSLEKGKLADLIVMDKNPLENIRNSESISFVMVNGRLYNASTMNETGNHPKARGKFWWEN